MKPHSFFALALAASIGGVRAEDAAPDFAAIFRIFDEHCVECHATDDFEAGLVLETYEGLMKGGESGAALVPGKSAESLAIKYLRGEVVKDGKKKFMPPGKRERLAPEEIQLLARWIDAGAKPGTTALVKREIKVPKIAPKVAPRNAINALAFAPQSGVLAVGRHGAVELVKADTREVLRRLEGHAGNVNALTFSADGATLFSASGENSVSGEVRVWNVADGKLVRTIQGHRDTIYALALSPDGKTLATGSYDQQIKLWNAETGDEARTLRGHNGAVFAVAFRPDGRFLASASADRTVKLWDAPSGQRRDTFSQPTKEQVALAWSGDGKRLAAAGFDNRIRVWEVSAEGKETTNPLLIARFAHELPVSRLAWSADGKTIASAAQDGTVKLWDAAEVTERALLERQPDWPSALAFAGDTLIVGRLDGTFACYDTKDGRRLAAASEPGGGAPVATNGGGGRAVGPGEVASQEPAPLECGATGAQGPAPLQAKAPPAKVTGVAPRGIQRGSEVELKLAGANLSGLKSVAAADARVQARVADGANANEARLFITTPRDLPRGAHDLNVTGPDGAAAGTVKVFIDDLPQLAMQDSGPFKLPAAIWGVLEKPGERARIEFDAKAGETLVFDLASKALGSKADAILSLVDAAGRVLASNNDFDAAGDPLIAHTFKSDGRYAALVSDLQSGGSAEHFFRLTAGSLAFVTACVPLSVSPDTESEVELIGYNLPAERKVKVKAAGAGEVAVPIDPEKFRQRRAFKVVVSALPVAAEIEPNNEPAQANAVSGAVSIAGKTSPPGDTDIFKFEAKKGSVWTIEAQAAQHGTPVDTRIEVLDAAGKKVERLLLQAVRDSAITFRGIDSGANDVRVEHWEEMTLNQFLFMNGEVARLFRTPEGPDSGFQLYTGNGKRLAYFNTTATAHALDEPCYIVEPHPPGTKLVANGLPSFTLYYENDDDGDRQIGTDSRLLFTAPADGPYLVRVSDSRGIGGERNAYRLVIREAQPDFNLTIAGAGPTVNAASGQGFTVNAERKDGFDGEITVEISGVPDGYKSTTPLVVQAGHLAARGSIHALPGAQALGDAEWGKVKVTATAAIAGAPVKHDAPNLGKVTLGGEAPLLVALEPVAPGDSLAKLSPPTPLQPQDPSKPFEITIAPGEIVPAWIKVTRNAHKAEVRFDVENLPHGVIVDNLGLNGITLLEGQNEGEIHLKADAWVPETDRLIFAITREAGKQTSLPVLLHVRNKPGQKAQTASVK